MSASERLAALADDVARLTKIEAAGPNAPAALDALAALPEIVAVVRAAEVLIEWVQNDHVAYGDERTLRVAVQALDAKLGGSP